MSLLIRHTPAIASAIIAGDIVDIAADDELLRYDDTYYIHLFTPLSLRLFTLVDYATDVTPLRPYFHASTPRLRRLLFH